MKLIAQKIHSEIKRAKHILLIPHQNPDGDALGSLTAMADFLQREKKIFDAFCATGITPKLAYLPHIERVKNDPTIWQDTSIDLIIVFDSGDLRYAGVAGYIEALPKKPTIIAIDHHVTNEHYGDLNLVIPGASSTAEVLYHFFVHNRITVTPTMATSLLTGLLTDTDRFSNGATSASALATGQALLNRGGNLNQIRDAVFNDKTVDTLRLWGAVLSRFEKHAVLDLVYTHVTLDDLANYHADEAAIEGIANYTNHLRDGRAALVLKETAPHIFKGSFRTTRDDVDVSRWAKALGGGGHKKAAGFTVTGSLEEVLQQIFAEIENIEKIKTVALDK